MSHENMAIRIGASTSLYKNLSNQEMKEAFKSELPQILEAYITTMEVTDNEELISGLEEVIGIYEDCIEPYAIELCKKLVENFKKLTSKEQGEDEYGGM